MTYSFSYLEPVCCSMSSSNSCFLTCIQISQEADQVVWYSHLFQNFSQFIVIHTVKGFGIVNKAEIDVFLELSCFFFSFFKKIYYYYYYFYFTILYWFCHTSTCIRHGCTHVPHPEPHLPPPSAYHPSVIQCTSPKLPISCIEPKGEGREL